MPFMHNSRYLPLTGLLTLLQRTILVQPASWNFLKYFRNVSRQKISWNFTSLVIGRRYFDLNYPSCDIGLNPLTHIELTYGLFSVKNWTFSLPWQQRTVMKHLNYAVEFTDPENHCQVQKCWPYTAIRRVIANVVLPWRQGLVQRKFD